MSYDLRFAVKAENGQFVDFCTPEYDQPTYNVGMIFRKCMGFNFEQGKYYKVSEIIDNLKHGLSETIINAKVYKKYEPDNGWGSVETVRKSLQSVIDCINLIEEQRHIPMDVVYLAW